MGLLAFNFVAAMTALVILLLVIALIVETAKSLTRWVKNHIL